MSNATAVVNFARAGAPVPLTVSSTGTNSVQVTNKVVGGTAVPLVCELTSGITIGDIQSIVNPVQVINSTEPLAVNVIGSVAVSSIDDTVNCNITSALGSSSAFPVLNATNDGYAIPLLTNVAGAVSVADIATCTAQLQVVNAPETVLQTALVGTPFVGVTSISEAINVAGIRDPITIGYVDTELNAHITNASIAVTATDALPVSISSANTVPVEAASTFPVSVQGTVELGGGVIGSVGGIASPVTVVTGPSALDVDIGSCPPIQVRNQSGQVLECVLNLAGYPQAGSLPTYLTGSNVVQVGNALTIGSGNVNAAVSGTVSLTSGTQVTVANGALYSLDHITNTVNTSIQGCAIALPVTNATGTSLAVNVNPIARQIWRSLDCNNIGQSLGVAGTLGTLTISHMMVAGGTPPATVSYTKLYTAFSGGIPTAADTPAMTIPCPLNQTLVIDLSDVTFAKFGIRTTAALDDSDNTPLATNECVVGLTYH